MLRFIIYTSSYVKHIQSNFTSFFSMYKTHYYYYFFPSLKFTIMKLLHFRIRIKLQKNKNSIEKISIKIMLKLE